MEEILRHDSLLRITLGRVQGKNGSGRPRTMFVGCLLKTEEDNISYDELKMLAQDRLIKMVSVKIEACHMGRVLQQRSPDCHGSAAQHANFHCCLLLLSRSEGSMFQRCLFRCVCLLTR